MGRGGGQVAVCSPCTLTIRVQIPLKPTFFSVKFVLEKNKNKSIEAGVGPFFKKTSTVTIGKRFKTNFLIAKWCT